MKLKLLEPHFTICKVADMGAVDWNAPFCFAARTDEECSLVCPDAYVPNDNLVRESGWRAVRIEGVLDYGLTGILAGIAGLLADREIPIFAVSTYNTDYVLLKEEKLSLALETLQENGYEIA